MGCPTLYLALYHPQEHSIVKTGGQRGQSIPQVIEHLTRTQMSDSDLSVTSLRCPCGRGGWHRNQGRVMPHLKSATSDLKTKSHLHPWFLFIMFVLLDLLRPPGSHPCGHGIIFRDPQLK